MNKVTSKAQSNVDMSSFMEAIFKNARVACILLLDGEGNILDVNIGFTETFGHTKEDLVGKHFSLLYTARDLEANRPKEELEEALINGFSEDNNYLIHKNGRAIWCHGESIIVCNTNEDRYFIKNVYDIQKQKELEKCLKRARDFSEGITDSINEALVVLDKDFNVIMSNAYFNKNYSPLENSLAGKYFFEMGDKAWDAPGLRGMFEKIIPDGTEVKDFEMEFDCPKLGKRILSLKARQITQKGEKQEQILIVLKDITLQKKSTESLSSKNVELNIINKDLDTFVYTASHDLKAPLNNFEGLFASLQEEEDEDAKKELFKMIGKSLEKLKATISDLAETGRAQAREGGDLTLIHFDELVQDVKLLLHKEVKDSKAVFIEDFSEAMSIYFSRKNLRSIIQNLISNAIKYHSPARRPEVKVRTTKVDRYILIEVSDNGLGIKELDKPKVFEMYHRLHDHVEGTGVGLSIVGRIVSNNGGKIEIDSEVGVGTTFKVYLKV